MREMQRLGPDHAIIVTEHSVIFVANNPPSPEIVGRIEQTLLAAARARPSGVGYLHHILDRRGRGSVDEPTRAAFSAVVRRSGHLVSGAAIVVAREGFAGAAMRSIVSGVILATRPSFPARVFAKTPEAARWLASALAQRGSVVDPAALVAAAEALEAELGREPLS